MKQLMRSLNQYYIIVIWYVIKGKGVIKIMARNNTNFVLKSLFVIVKSNAFIATVKNSNVSISTPRLQLYMTQVRPHMKYCSLLRARAPKYQLLSFDGIKRTADRIADRQVLSVRLDSLALRKDVSSLCDFYRVYHREGLEELSRIELNTAIAIRGKPLDTTTHTTWIVGIPPPWAFAELSDTHHDLVESVAASGISAQIPLRVHQEVTFFPP